jgi:hypothetical protein
MTAVTHKVCPHADCPFHGVEQPMESFGRNDSRHDGKAYYCRKCATRLSAIWKKAHPDQDRAYRRDYAARNRERNRAARAAREAAASDEGRYVPTE